MKKIYLLVVLLCTASLLNAQVTLTGIVKDSIGNSLEMANVVAVNKATKKMASFGFTDQQGRYKLELSKNTVYSLKVSFVGMKPKSLSVTTKESDFSQDITLQNDNTLDEVTIVSKMPVTVKGDTIIYNADSFKNGSERKLEDVLKKLPGVEVTEDGEIEIDGKKVEKVMVEGKDFFDGDSKIATKNIPSNAVDKIQVLRNYNDVGQLSGVTNNQDRIAINIKLKEGKKNFWFGDIRFGGGNSSVGDARYILQPKLFYYNPKYSINFIGDLNNLGESAFTRRDFNNFTGVGRPPINNSGTEINIGTNLNGFLNVNRNNSTEFISKFGAANFSYSPSKKLDLSGFVLFSNNIISTRNNNTIEYISDDTDIPLDEFTESRARQNSNLGAAKFSVAYRPNTNNQLDYDLVAKLSDEVQNQSLNSSVIGQIEQEEGATPYSINQSMNYYYTLNNTNIFAVSAESLFSNEDPFYNAFIEDNDTYASTGAALGLNAEQLGYTISQNKKVRTNQFDGKLDYWNILNQKSNINFTFGSILSNQNFDSEIFQILDNGDRFAPTPSINNGIATNDTEYNFTDFYLGAHYQLKSGLFTFTPGFTVHAYKAKNTQQGVTYTDKFNRFQPDFRMRIQLKQSENITLQYNMLTQFTDVNQLARGLVLNNYNSIFAGNQELESAVINRIRLSYFSFNMFNYTNIFANITYSNVVDRIRNRIFFEPGNVIGVRNPFNSNFADETVSGFFNISKTIRKLRFSFRSFLNYSKYNQFLRNESVVNKVFTQSYTPGINSNFRKAPNFSIKYGYSINTSNLGDTANKTYTNAPTIDFDAYIWEKITFKTDYSYTFITNGSETLNEFDLWNASFLYRNKDDSKFEYEVKIANILDA